MLNEEQDTSADLSNIFEQIKQQVYSYAKKKVTSQEIQHSRPIHLPLYRRGN